MRQVPLDTIEQILLVHDDATRSADPYLQQIVSFQRPALSLFVEGSQRSDALNDDDTTASGVFALAKLSLAEGERLQSQGDLSGAWNLYRASLRAGRHLGQRSGWSGRSLGISLQEDSTDRVVRWSLQTGIDHDLLKTAISDLEALDAMTPPDWLTMRYEYLAALDRLASSTPGQARPELRDSLRADAFLRNEPERSRRVLRLIFTNWLDEWSKPAADRTSPVDGVPSLYSRPDSRPRVSPVRLQEWYATSDLATWSPPLVDFPALTDAPADDLVLLSNLIVHLAERRYILDHHEPPTYPEGLLGLYLNRIPTHYLPSRPLFSENLAVPLDTDPLSP